MKILDTNTKLAKPVDGANIAIVGCTMAPHSIGGGPTVCEGSSAGCRAACVMHFAGRRVMEGVRAAALERKRLWFDNPQEFNRRLHNEIEGKLSKLDDLGIDRLLVRLNAASDIRWESTGVMERYIGDGRVTFYDYTKLYDRVRAYLKGDMPTNYHLTFSAHERHRYNTLRSVLERGGNVAVVFDVQYNPQHGKIGDLPERYMIGRRSYDVIDGDKHDARLPEFDGRGNVIGLRLKGVNKAKDRAKRKGFAM